MLKINANENGCQRFKGGRGCSVICMGILDTSSLVAEKFHLIMKQHITLLNIFQVKTEYSGSVFGLSNGQYFLQAPYSKIFVCTLANLYSV